VGYFYTQGLPEDTKALSHDILNDDEYLDLAYQIIREREGLLDYELKRFEQLDRGVLFFYFSSLDQDSHMFWRTMDAAHPMYSKMLGKKYSTVIKQLYIKMDQMLGKVMGSFYLWISVDERVFKRSNSWKSQYNLQESTWLEYDRRSFNNGN